MTAKEVAERLAAMRAEADQHAEQAAKHRAKADRLDAESRRLAVESVHLDAPPGVLDESIRLRHAGIAEHGAANAHAQRALMLRGKADRIEAAAAGGAHHG